MRPPQWTPAGAIMPGADDPGSVAYTPQNPPPAHAARGQHRAQAKHFPLRFSPVSQECAHLLCVTVQYFMMPRDAMPTRLHSTELHL